MYRMNHSEWPILLTNMWDFNLNCCVFKNKVCLPVWKPEN